MSMSGIKIDPKISILWNDVKLSKIHKYVGLKLSDDRKMVIIDEEILGEKCETNNKEDDEECFNKMKNLVKPDEPRYLVYDFGLKRSDGRDYKKTAFIYWCSNDCPIKKKMVYTATKENVKKVLAGIGNFFEIHDLQELDYAELTETLLKK